MDERNTIVLAGELDAAGMELLNQAKDIRLAGPCSTAGELKAALADAGATILPAHTHFDENLLAAAPHLKALAVTGASLENVDMEAATRRGVLVIHAPQANLVAAAEHSLALLLALARGISRQENSLRAGNWSHQTAGFQLYGKVLGIIGLGQVGREVAARAAGFGMRILAYDPYVDPVATRGLEVELVNFTELLERADVISLHAAHTPETHRMIAAAELERMKPGACLVNCAHPGLVDEGALCAALQSGRLGGAALDVFDDEPLPAGHPLLELDNVVLTPHINQHTREARQATARESVEDLLAALRGEDYRNVANLPFNRSIPYRQVRPYIHLASKLGKLQGQLAGGWIRQVEVEVQGEGLRQMVRPIAAVLLAGMLLPAGGALVNWVSAPVLAHGQGIVTAQVKGLVRQEDYPNIIACRICWEGGSRTVAGVLFANGEARLVQYDNFPVDAYPEGYVLVLENDDIPGVIGKVGTRLGRAQINIAQWRYGREVRGGRAVSFLNLDSRPPASILAELEQEPEIHRARLVHL